MGEVHVVGLLLVNKPFDFLFLLHVFAHETGLVGILALNEFMAADTVCIGGQAGVGTILPKGMTIFTCHGLIIHMHDVIEPDGLGLLTVQDFWKAPPTKHDRCRQTDQEWQHHAALAFCHSPLLLPR